MKTKKPHNVLNKFMMLCLAALVATLGCCRLATPGREKLFDIPLNFKWYSFEKEGKTNRKTEWFITTPAPTPAKPP